MSVIIVGAGVIGLTCAYQLADKGYNIEIIARDFPSTGLSKPEYTSSKSGAHFRPFPSADDKQFKDSRLARSTYNAFKGLAKTHPESSILWLTGTDYLGKADPNYLMLKRGLTEGIEDFRVIPKDNLPVGAVFGCEYKTWVINSPAYLDFLERRLRFHYGVTFHQDSVFALKDVAKAYPGSTIVNCTGLGLQYDGSWDPDCYQIRGQTLLVRAPVGCEYLTHTITWQLANGEWTFVIPRPLDGGIIVGGTKVIGKLGSLPDPVETTALINNAVVKFPELLIDGRLDVQKINVGFRPARKGGVKIESQWIDGSQIIDCYGFGGSGMEMSWGAAEKVVEILTNRAKL